MVPPPIHQHLSSFLPTQDLVSRFYNLFKTVNDLTAKPNVTGSRASGAALVSLLSALASLGIITDSTTP